MDINKLNSMVTRVFFFVAFALLALAVLEKLLNVMGQTLTRAFAPILPSTLLQWSMVLLGFVVALLLRQIREELKNR